MRYFFVLLCLMLMSNVAGQNPPVQLLHINAEWNERHNVDLSGIPKDYKGYRIKVDFALLENQGPQFKKSVQGKPLPILVLRVGGKVKYQWSADLSFQIKATKTDIMEIIDKTLNLK